MKTPKWYVKVIAFGQALVIDEETGRTVAVIYDSKDAEIIMHGIELMEVEND